MSDDTYLFQSEIKALTGRVRPSAQIKRLAGMKINAVRGADGKVRVLREHHDAVLSGDPKRAKKAHTEEPNWNAIV